MAQATKSSKFYEVIDLLKQGWSLEDAIEECGYARSAVKRFQKDAEVRALLDKGSDDIPDPEVILEAALKSNKLDFIVQNASRQKLIVGAHPIAGWAVIKATWHRGSVGYDFEPLTHSLRFYQLPGKRNAKVVNLKRHRAAQEANELLNDMLNGIVPHERDAEVQVVKPKKRRS